jgi:hypothetical protein
MAAGAIGQRKNGNQRPLKIGSAASERLVIQSKIVFRNRGFINASSALLFLDLDRLIFLGNRSRDNRMPDSSKSIATPRWMEINNCFQVCDARSPPRKIGSDCSRLWKKPNVLDILNILRKETKFGHLHFLICQRET